MYFIVKWFFLHANANGWWVAVFKAWFKVLFIAAQKP
jgi:hypothetical protein